MIDPRPVEIELRDLTVRYGDATALGPVNARFGAGRRVAILGPSGAGKTTLLRAVAGLETPSAGEVRFDARPAGPPRDRGVAMVFPTDALCPHLRARDNIAFPLRARRSPSDEIDERVHLMASSLGIDQILDRRPDELSSGERQRVAFARALVRSPRALLLDEPFGRLDPPLRRSLESLLIDLHGEHGWTMLLVSHDPDRALALVDEIVFLEAGRVVQRGTPDEVREDPGSPLVAAFLGIDR